MQTKVNRQIPNTLRKYRRIRHLSQQEIAQVLGIKGSSRVSKWENGECLPSLENAIRLAIICRTMVDGLFGDLERKLRGEILEREKKIFQSKDS